ncbi:Molybdenum cofactor sulfurase [Acorus calamus]|uniref:Molybdenum cofactor sulfurase n=1 Tax=Acorus calamus TaxID=4465 RepID=A0AAV9C978_ACOCL|nr:Molybdenum cofactor sulfurase [Acorus calamus]
MLKKTYFSGGTVSASIANIDFVKRREGIEELLEDGTQSFLNISSIRHGFNIINTLTTSAIVRHTTMLASYVRKTLMELRHENGAVVCTIYGSNIGKVLNLGPTIAFNLKRPDGSWFGYREVEKLASLSGIQLRTGCFCNPGACAKYLGLSTADLLSNVEAGRVCWDDNDILHGKPTGAVRVSFGYMSTFEDAKKFIMFIRHSFVVVPYIIGSGHISRKKIFSAGIGRRHLARSLHLESITVYPIKSCSGFSVDRWALNNTGLQYDREWLIRGINGDIFTQKKVPEMRLINTIIDLNLGKLFVESPRCKVKLEINLDQNLSCGEKEELELLGQRYQVQGYDDEVNMWFAEALARPCMLLRYCGSEYLNPVTKKCRPQTCRDEQSRLNFVNEAQFLLISEESVCDLNDRLSSNARKGKYGPGQNIHVDAMRFRPNLIISGAEPYEEDSWRRLTIGGAYFTSLGGCNRCEMINLDFQSGEVRKSKEPLATLASFRRVKGKILFGILLRYDSSSNEYEGGNEETWLEVGQKVHPDMS